MAPVYRFLPWARRGLARGITASAGAATPARATIAVELDAGGDTAKADVALYGPGDVTGIDRRVVLRTDPARGATDFEPNYLAAIEFDPPDFPWMFSPRAAAKGRILPWCVLVVVERRPGVSFAVNADAPLPVLSIEPPADFRVELPDLTDSWAWAHGQLLEEPGGADAPDLDADPDRNLSRLICPRRLKPETRYRACVVPAFAQGVARGLGRPLAGAGLAWSVASGGNVSELELPVYHFWEFATAGEDDVEAMAERLHGPEHPPADLGRRRVFAAAGHPSFAALALPAAARAVTMHGALRPVEPGATPEPGQAPKLTSGIAAVVRKRSGPELPVPLYGEWHTEQHALPDENGWLRELNTGVGHRIAAALGAEVVRRHQDDFVQAAWEQAGQAAEANRLAARARLSAAVLDRLIARHIAPRGADRVLQLAGPLLARVAVSSDGGALPTVAAALEDASVPDGAASAAYRRLASGQRQAMKRAVRRARLAPGPGLIALTAGTSGAALVEPAPAAPDGVTGLRDRDALVPSGRTGAVSLRVLGLPGQTTSAEVAKLAPLTKRIPDLPTTPRDFFPPAELPALISHVTGRTAKPSRALPPTKQRPPQPVADVKARKIYNLMLGRAAVLANAPMTQATFRAADADGLGTRIRDRIAARTSVARRVRSIVGGAGAASYDPYRGVEPFPVMPDSTVQYLDQLPGGWVLPEAAGLEPDTAILLRTDREFTSAFLVGLNHEMNRELLWRGYPTDQRGTPFQHFWNRVDGEPDVEAIHTWPAEAPLRTAGTPRAGAGADAEQTVLLLRGQLLRRYPDMVIYATTGTRRAPGTGPIPAKGQPQFFARLEPDFNLVGFALTPAELLAQDWWFVLEQQLTAPRFGFDAESAKEKARSTWADMRWSQLKTEAGAHVRLAREPFANGTVPTPGGRRFGVTADQIAISLLQLPIRVALHRDRLLVKPEGGG